MEGNKILFLDIDGVLNSVRSAYALGGYPHSTEDTELGKFDHVALALVRRLCKETGCQIVLSSTWRIIHPFKRLGDDLNLPIIDRTPQLGGARGHEIKHWLDRNECERYAIVDDDTDMLPEQIPFFVQTSGTEGMSLRHYKQLEKLLSKDA